LDRVAKFVHLCLNKKEGDKPTFLTKGTILTKPLINQLLYTIKPNYKLVSRSIRP